MDVVANRERIAQLRNRVAKIPLLWMLYGLYWKIRRHWEYRKDYPSTTTLVDFGPYPNPNLEVPTSQLCTAQQMMSATYDRWCRAMNSPARFSRKQWEFVFILRALEVAGMLKAGKTGLGFGCGREPLAGLFAAQGCHVLATDLARDSAKERGWVNTLQHSENLDELYETASAFITKPEFMERVRYQSVDMNAIPTSFDDQFDFVWSACALEHLGSLRHGLDFIKKSSRCLKLGGIAVHTTEFNLSSNDHTFESPSCSIYRAKDIEELCRELRQEGYLVAPLNLNHGASPVDRHIDIPPYGFSPHLKLALESFVVTSIGLIIRR